MAGQDLNRLTTGNNIKSQTVLAASVKPAKVIGRALNAQTVFPLVKGKISELLDNPGISGISNSATIEDLHDIFSNIFYLKEFYSGRTSDNNQNQYILPKTNFFLQGLLKSPEKLTPGNIGGYTHLAQEEFNIFLNEQVNVGQGLRISEDSQFGWNTCTALLAQKLIQEGVSATDKLYGYTLLMMLANRKLSGTGLNNAIQNINQQMKVIILKALQNKIDTRFMGLMYYMTKDSSSDSKKIPDRIYLILQILSIKSQLKALPELKWAQIWNEDLKIEGKKAKKAKYICESTPRMLETYGKRLAYINWLKKNHVLIQSDKVQQLIAKGDPRFDNKVNALKNRSALYLKIVNSDPRQVSDYLDHAMISVNGKKDYNALSKRLFSEIVETEKLSTASQGILGVSPAKTTEIKDLNEKSRLPEKDPKITEQVDNHPRPITISISAATRPILAVIEGYEFSTKIFNLIENLGANKAVYKRVEDPKYITKQDALQGLYLMLTKLMGGDMKKACEWISENRKIISISDIRLLMQNGQTVVSTENSQKLARLFTMLTKNPKNLYYIGMALRYQENANINAWKVVSANKGQMAYVLPYIKLVNDVFVENNRIPQNLLNQIKQFKTNDEQEVSLEKQVKNVTDRESWKAMMASINQVSNINIDGLLSFAFGKKVSTIAVISSKSVAEDKLDIRKSVSNYLKDVDLSVVAETWSISTRDKKELIDMLLAKVESESEKRVLAIMNSKELGVLESSKDTVIFHQRLIQLDCIFSAIQRMKEYTADRSKAIESLATTSEETSYNANDELMYLSIISKSLSSEMNQKLAIYKQGEDKRIADSDKEKYPSEMMQTKDGWCLYDPNTGSMIALNGPEDRNLKVAIKSKMSMKVAMKKAAKIGLSSERAKIDLEDKRYGQVGVDREEMVFGKMIGVYTIEINQSGQSVILTRSDNRRATFMKSYSKVIYDRKKNEINWGKLREIESSGFIGLADVDKKKKLQVLYTGKPFKKAGKFLRRIKTARDEILYYKLLSYESPQYLYAQTLRLFSSNNKLEGMKYLGLLFENIYTNERNLENADMIVADVLNDLRKESFDDNEDKFQKVLFSQLSIMTPPFIAKRLFYSVYHQIIEGRLFNVGFKNMTPEIKMFIERTINYLKRELILTESVLTKNKLFETLNKERVEDYEKVRIITNTIYDTQGVGAGYYFNKIIYENALIYSMNDWNIGGLKVDDEDDKYSRDSILLYVKDLEELSKKLQSGEMTIYEKNKFAHIFDYLVTSS